MLRAIQQEVDQIFDKADHPNVVHTDDFDYDALLNIRKLPMPQKQTIDVLKDVLQGIIYISSHLIIYKPCQIFKEHLINKHGKWGIRNLICYRDPNQNPIFDPSRYWPADYQYHPDDSSELVWSIGRLWFQLLTDSQLPPIKSLSQDQLDRMINYSGIKDLTIIPLLKSILQIDHQKRIQFSQITTHSFFEFQNTSMLDIQSVLPISSYSASKLIKDGFATAGKYTMIQSGYNPFKQQLFKRDFKEAIVIAELFDKVKNWIFDNFQVQQNKNQIDFSCYLIQLMSYLKLKNFQIQRDKQMYDLVVLSDKRDYTKFMQKVLYLSKKLQKRRKIKKFDEFRQKLPECLCMLENIDYDLVQKQFKGYLSTYAHHLQQKRIKNHDKSPSFIKNYIIMIQMLLVRCSKYIFSNCRSYLFEDFIDPSGFDMRSVINNIENCKDYSKLQRIDEKIQKLYFH